MGVELCFKCIAPDTKSKYFEVKIQYEIYSKPGEKKLMINEHHRKFS